MKKHCRAVLTFTLLFTLATVIPAAGASSAKDSGAFTGCFSLDTKNGPSIGLHLVFSTGNQAVTGYALIDPSPIEPLVFEEHVYGSFFIITIMDVPYLTIQGNGYPDIAWPPNGGIGPVILPNLEFRLSTPSSVKGRPAKGTLRLRNESGEWGPWFEGNVESFPCETP